MHKKYVAVAFTIEDRPLDGNHSLHECESQDQFAALVECALEHYAMRFARREMLELCDFAYVLGASRLEFRLFTEQEFNAKLAEMENNR